jgi:NADH pyrophosphatase NudC (nudix superfamily)
MRLIDADAFKAQVSAVTALQGLNVEKAALLLRLIDQQPTIDAEPVVHARWMQDDTLKDLYFCSKCLTRDHRKPKHKFCPDCGARMDADAPERGREVRHG